MHSRMGDKLKRGGRSRYRADCTTQEVVLNLEWPLFIVNYSLNQCLANSLMSLSYHLFMEFSNKNPLSGMAINNYEPLSYRDFGYVNVGNFLTQQKSVKKISDHPDSSRLHSYSQLFSFLQFALRIHFFLI